MLLLVVGAMVMKPEINKSTGSKSIFEKKMLNLVYLLSRIKTLIVLFVTGQQEIEANDRINESDNSVASRKLPFILFTTMYYRLL